MTDQCPVCRGDVPLVDGKLIVHRHRDQFGPCPAGQVEPSAFTVAQAEEWARWAAVHDDWDQTRECMGVLLAEYDRRGEELAENVGVMNALRRHRDTAETQVAELAKTVADCGICRLGSRTIHINDDCPRHGDTDGEGP